MNPKPKDWFYRSIQLPLMLMAERFDPYRKWLGIPEQDQPPNHYRLLGIELFESDADVISNAADGRMAQIKVFQAGKYSDLSQKLLNEIATAKVCLLNPARKAQYDQQLSERGVGRAITSAQEAEFSVDLADESPGMLSASRTQSRRVPAHLHRKSHAPWMIAVVAVAAAAVVIAGIVVVQDQQESKTPAPPASPKIVVAQPKLSPKPQPTKPVEPKQPSPNPVVSVPKPTPRPVQKKRPESQPAVATKPAKPTLVMTPDPDQSKGRQSKEPAAPPEKPKILPVPNEAQQRKSEAKIRDVFGRDFEQATTPDMRIALADQLWEQSKQEKCDPIDGFVLRRLSYEQLAAADQVERSFEQIDETSDVYEIDPLATKAEILTALIAHSTRSGVRNLSVNQDLSEMALRLAEEAGTKTQFDVASRLTKQATALARSTKDGKFIRDTAARVQKIERMKGRFAVVQKAIDALARDPNDPDANLTVGRWRCFGANNWDQGLPLLAKGSNAALAEVAKRDIAKPTEPNDQMSVGDGWWDIAANEQGIVKSAAMARSVHWYDQALPNLSGLDRTKVQKHLEAANAEAASATSDSSEVPAAPAKNRGAIRKGNVALGNNGTIVTGDVRQGECLIDGVTAIPYKGLEGAAYGSWPCEWCITFDKVYRLQEIRFRLWDKDRRFFNYAIMVSADGNTYTQLEDHSQGQWASWQQIKFPPRPVKSIKLIGLRCSMGKTFSVIEFEAYCIPPPK